MTEDEVSAKEQALMALRLEESVRELIRKEITAAFADQQFMIQFDSTLLAESIIIRHTNGPAFRTAVKQAMQAILNGTYG